MNSTKINNKVNSILKFNNEDEKFDFDAKLLNLEIIYLLEKYMTKNHISKKDLAEKLGTSKSYITQIFTSDKLLNLKMLSKIQNIFDIKFNISLSKPKKDKKSKNVYPLFSDNQNFLLAKDSPKKRD